MKEQFREVVEDENAFYREAFSRNIGLLGQKGQDRLRNSTVAVAGLGGVGGNYAYALTRLGVGSLHIADNDRYDYSNLNRQMGSGTETLGDTKVSGVETIIKSINPYCKIRSFDQGITDETVDAFLEGVDVVIDAIEFFEIDARQLLIRKARAKGLYVINAAAIGFGSALMTFDPRGMRFEEYFKIDDSMGKQEKMIQFALGVGPAMVQKSYFKPTSVSINLEKRAVPSLVLGTLLCANLAVTETVKILLGKKVLSAPHSIQFDPFVGKLRKVWLPGGNHNPIQLLKKHFLKKKMAAAGKI